MTTTMTMTNICKLIRKNGSAIVTLKGEAVEIGFEGMEKQGTLVMLGGGYYKVSHVDGRKFDIAKGERITVVI